jgi:hypothetical protein
MKAVDAAYYTKGIEEKDSALVLKRQAVKALRDHRRKHGC